MSRYNVRALVNHAKDVLKSLKHQIVAEKEGNALFQMDLRSFMELLRQNYRENMALYTGKTYEKLGFMSQVCTEGFGQYGYTFLPTQPQKQEPEHSRGKCTKAAFSWKLHEDGTVEITHTHILLKGIAWDEEWNAVIHVPAEINGHPVTRISGNLGSLDFSVVDVPFWFAMIRWHAVIPSTVREISSNYFTAEEIQPEDFMIADCDGIWHISKEAARPDCVSIYAEPGSYARQFAREKGYKICEKIPEFVSEAKEYPKA